MNLLESFFFLFESDASGLDKGLEESRKKAEGAEKSVKAVDVAANKLGDSLAQTIRQVGGMLAAGFAVSGLTRAMLDAANAADKLDEAAGARGMSVETLSAWGGAATIAGGSVEALIGSIDLLDSSLAQMQITGTSRAAPFLKELGIDLDSAAYKGKTATELLLPIADAFEGLSKSQQIGIGKKLGFDMGTIMLLQMGRREIEAQIAKQRELGVVTKAQGEIAAKFNDQQDYTRMAFRSVWLEVAQSVLPWLTRGLAVLEKFATFLRKHSDFVVGLMIALGSAIAVFVLPPLIKMAVAAAVAFAPFLIMGAVVAGLATAFALLWEDVRIFLEGGDSLLGKLIDKFPMLADAARFVGDVFMGMWEAIKFIFDAIASGAGFIGKLLGFGGAGDAMVALAQKSIGEASASPLAARSSNSISNSVRGGNSSAVNIGEVKVQTQATDADGISRAIGGSLQTQMQQAVANYDDGVAA